MSSLFDRRRQQQRRRASPRKRTLPKPGAPLQIQRLSHDGRGVTRNAAGKTVFVSNALPGESVDVAVHHARGRYDEAHVKTWHSHSSHRLAPPCKHFLRCGGCQLQHVASAEQLAHKEAVIREQLQHFGHLTQLPEFAKPLRGHDYGYRRKARLGVKRRSNGQLMLGFRESGSKHLTPIQECPVLVPELAALLTPLWQLLPELTADSQIGHLELLQASVAGQPRAVVVVRLLGSLTEPDQQAWTQFAARQECLVLCQYKHQLTTLAGEQPPELVDESSGLPLNFQALDFLQVNAAVNQQMVARAVHWLNLTPGEQLLDLFSGFGNFALPAAQSGVRVLGLEGSPGLVTQARNSAQKLGLTQTEFQVQDLTQPLPRWLATNWQKVILDPPRAGAAELMPELTRLAPELILYVSCNPATLGRDLGQLTTAGYTLEKLCLVDMFPQTRHVETMVLLRRTTND